MNTDVQGRRALVTGASSGIGAACAVLAAQRGYRVALLARRAAELERVRAAMARPDDHLALVCDVRDPAAVAAAMRAVAERWSGLDLLVNNAGTGYRAPVEEFELEPARAVLETNVLAPLSVCRAALPLLRKGARPVVVNVSSVVGWRGFPELAVYSASKAALTSIGQSLRLEWAKEGIAVCNFSPARTHSGFFAAQANPRRRADPDLSRAADPYDVARALLELDPHPRPESTPQARWRWFGALSILAPRFADRVLARKLGKR